MSLNYKINTYCFSKWHSSEAVVVWWNAEEVQNHQYSMWLPICVIRGVSQYSCYTRAKKQRDPRGFANLTCSFDRLSHSYWFGTGILVVHPWKITISLLWKVYGDKVTTQQFVFGTQHFHTSYGWSDHLLYARLVEGGSSSIPKSQSFFSYERACYIGTWHINRLDVSC